MYEWMDGFLFVKRKEQKNMCMNCNGAMMLGLGRFLRTPCLQLFLAKENRTWRPLEEASGYTAEFQKNKNRNEDKGGREKGLGLGRGPAAAQTLRPLPIENVGEQTLLLHTLFHVAG
jgi:hypothetical protein